MFGIDFSEILVIFGIALVVLGPEKLPRVAQQIGRWVGRARAMARQFRDQLEQETDTLRRATDFQQSKPTPPPKPTASSMMASPSASEPGGATGGTTPSAGTTAGDDTSAANPPPESHERR
jgi:sec-independent protein translocase protein TatB